MTNTTPRAAWGVDGCKAGWFWFRLPLSPAGQISWGVVKKLRSLFEQDKVNKVSEHDSILVDIPIGLPSVEGGKKHGRRSCDKEAICVLGEPSSVFMVPGRVALTEFEEMMLNLPDGQVRSRKTLAEVARKIRPLSPVSAGVLPKIYEVDHLLQNCERARAILQETHPEVCFLKLNRGPLAFRKKHGLGFLNRVAVIERVRPGSAMAIRDACCEHRDVDGHDIVDAMVCAVTASAHNLKSLCDDSEELSDGIRLPRQIRYAEPEALPTRGEGDTALRDWVSEVLEDCPSRD